MCSRKVGREGGLATSMGMSLKSCMCSPMPGTMATCARISHSSTVASCQLDGRKHGRVTEVRLQVVTCQGNQQTSSLHDLSCKANRTPMVGVLTTNIGRYSYQASTHPECDTCSQTMYSDIQWHALFPIVSVSVHTSGPKGEELCAVDSHYRATQV